MARGLQINSKGPAPKVKKASQIKDSAAKHECPSSHPVIDNNDVLSELPIGVKFDPSGAELLEYLAAKCGIGDSRPQMSKNELIRTLEGDNGIYHPENLPYVKKDGSSVYFFHKMARSAGQKKPGMVDSSAVEKVYWHQTGKIRAISEHGGLKMFRKILVLYKGLKKSAKAVKLNWVRHQYHLETEHHEKAGEFVVSKIFYQQKKYNLVIEDSDNNAVLRTSPRNPSIFPPNMARPGKSASCDDVPDEDVLPSHAEEAELPQEPSYAPQPNTQFEDNMGLGATSIAGESQTVDTAFLTLVNICDEIHSFPLPDGSVLNANSSPISYEIENGSGSYGIGGLENLEHGTQLESSLSYMPLYSPESLGCI